MKDIIKPIGVLGVICLVSGFGTAYVNNITRDRIVEAQNQKKLAAIKEVLPFDEVHIEAKHSSDGFGMFEVRDLAGTLLGVAIESPTDKGYSGRINVLVGVSRECKVSDYKVLTHTETPGLGDKITKPAFRKQFHGRSLMDFIWKVKKDRGDVDAITAATISSRAVTEAIEKGLKLYQQYYGNGCN